MSDGLTPKQALLAKIAERQARISIIGMGYVGLPLAIEFPKAGFRVYGIDLNEAKCAQINAGQSYTYSRRREIA